MFLSCSLLLLFYFIFFSCLSFLFLSFFCLLVKHTNSTKQKQMNADWTSSGRSTKNGKRTDVDLMSSGCCTKNRKRTVNPKRQTNWEEKICFIVFSICCFIVFSIFVLFNSFVNKFNVYACFLLQSSSAMWYNILNFDLPSIRDIRRHTTTYPKSTHTHKTSTTQ